MKKIIFLIALLLLYGCTRTRICTCINEHIQHPVQVDITHCPEFEDCSDLNDSYLTECREI